MSFRLSGFDACLDRVVRRCVWCESAENEFRVAHLRRRVTAQIGGTVVVVVVVGLPACQIHAVMINRMADGGARILFFDLLTTFRADGAGVHVTIVLFGGRLDGALIVTGTFHGELLTRSWLCCSPFVSDV